MIDDHEHDTLYIFGHAGEGFPVTGNADDLVVQRHYFESVLEHVERGMAAGRSQEQIVTLEQVPGMNEHRSTPQSVARVLNVAFEELSAEQ